MTDSHVEAMFYDIGTGSDSITFEDPSDASFENEIGAFELSDCKLHCLVPGGALADDGHWKATRGNYLFPVQALSRHFRGRMVSLLRQAATRGALHRVTRPGEVDTLLDTLMTREWVVYTKDCLDHTGTVVEYLARYTQRIAITSARLARGR